MDLMPAGEVLATTLATDFAPASNLRGEAAGAAWRYLLPTMERERVLCLGRPPAATLRTLARTAGEVTVVGSGARTASGAAGDQVRAVEAAALESWLAARPDASVDLVWIGAEIAGIRETRHAFVTAVRALPRLLSTDGVVVREHRRGIGPGRGPARVATATGPDGRTTVWIVVRPDGGEVRSAVAEGDEEVQGILAERGLDGPAIGRRIPGPRQAGALVDRIVGSRVRRWLEISIPPGASTLPGPPDYLIDLAAADGVDVRGWRCALSATGVYNTQKVLGLLSAPGDSTPSLIVKMTRDPSVVARLENERDALRALHALGMTADARVPQVRFAGRHAGLAIVGESALDGRVVRSGARGPGSVDPAADAVAWLTDLAARSARPAAAADVATALGELHGRFAALCRPEPEVTTRLEAAIATIASSSSAVPLVFQHGDPGTWNLLQRDDGTVAFLDWENADAAGMPLWDLLYLLRSHAVGAGRRAGTRRRLAAVERFLLDTSPLSDFVVGSVQRYAERIGLDRGLIEPIFHACWMHQALKEATRVAPDRVRAGHYNRLLRLGLDRRTAPNLRRIFEGGAR